MRARGKAPLYQPLGEPETDGRKYFKFNVLCLHTERRRVVASGNALVTDHVDRLDWRLPAPDDHRPIHCSARSCRDRNPAARAMSSAATSRWTGSLVRWKADLDSRACGRATVPNRAEPVLPVRTESVSRLSSRAPVAACSVSQFSHCTREHRTGRRPNSTTTGTTRRRVVILETLLRGLVEDDVHPRETAAPPPDARTTRCWYAGAFGHRLRDRTT